MDFSIFLLVTFALLEISAGRLSCKNDKKEETEWFLMIKLPKTGKGTHNSSIETTGTELAYIDASTKSTKNGWRLLNARVTDANRNPLALTMENFFKGGKKSNNSLFITYNDQPPKPYNGSSRGHTKGVIEFDNDSGYWLLHTVPQFPAEVFQSDYNYPSSGHNNGQTFMCITYNITQLDKIMAALRQQYPYIYEGEAFGSFRSNAGVDQVLKRKFERKPKVLVLKDIIPGSKGTSFYSFAKHHRTNKDIYADFITSTLGVDLLVEVWRNGAGGRLGASCPRKGYNVLNVRSMHMQFQNGTTVEFKTTEDHSKWAVSADKRSPWVCVSSLNRMISQYSRGGQAMCFKNEVAHNAFATSIDSCEMCKDPSKESYCKKRIKTES